MVLATPSTNEYKTVYIDTNVTTFNDPNTSSSDKKRSRILCSEYLPTARASKQSKHSNVTKNKSSSSNKKKDIFIVPSSDNGFDINLLCSGIKSFEPSNNILSTITKNIRNYKRSTSNKNKSNRKLLRSSQLSPNDLNSNTITSTYDCELNNMNRCYLEDFILLEQHQKICILIPTHGNKSLKNRYVDCIKYLSLSVVSLLSGSTNRDKYYVLR